MEKETDQEDYMLLAQEANFLASKGEKFSRKDIANRFGSHRNYLMALIQYHHPRHNEAMTIRNANFIPRMTDPETETLVDRARTATNFYLQSRYDF